MLVLELFLFVPLGLAYLAGILLLLAVAQKDDRKRKSGAPWRLPVSLVAVLGFGLVCTQNELLFGLFLLPLWYAVGMPVALTLMVFGFEL